MPVLPSLLAAALASALGAVAIRPEPSHPEPLRPPGAPTPGPLGEEAPAERARATSRADALAVYARFRELGLQPLWPGFDPLSVPVAIFDRQRTVLFGHPSPPESFRAVDAFPGVFWMDGAHESVRANTSVDLGGTRTATLLLDPAESDTHGPAAVLVHETFHVFQDETHPEWRADESALFEYPVEDSEILVSRRLEVEALRRALASLNPRDVAGWAARALDYRARRHLALDAESRDYERDIERYEGLARYLQDRCLDAPPAALPAGGHPAEDIRQRGYRTGAALARLLDRLAGGWRGEFQAAGDPHLDRFLEAALGEPQPGEQRPDFSEEERRAIADRAVLDAARLRVQLADARRAFSDRPGWSVEVHAPPERPLFPQGFDPLNVRRLSALEVLHTRWVRLGNLEAAIEVQDREALTYGSGDHALFQGVARLLVTGFDEEPSVEEAGEELTVEAPGLSATLTGAVADRKGRRWVVELPR